MYIAKVVYRLVVGVLPGTKIFGNLFAELLSWHTVTKGQWIL